jgi:hypothetical protein
MPFPNREQVRLSVSCDEIQAAWRVLRRMNLEEEGSFSIISRSVGTGCFPCEINALHTNCTRPVAGSDGRGFVQKENTILYVATPRDGRPGATAVEASVDLRATVTTQRTWNAAWIGLSVLADQSPGFLIGHPYPLHGLLPVLVSDSHAFPDLLTHFLTALPSRCRSSRLRSIPQR